MHRCRGHCRNLLPWITDFLEGEAGGSVCRRIELHMVGCEKCRMYVDTHRKVIRLYSNWRDEDISRGAEIRLKERLEKEWSRGTGKPRRR